MTSEQPPGARVSEVAARLYDLVQLNDYLINCIPATFDAVTATLWMARTRGRGAATHRYWTGSRLNARR